MYTYNIYKCVCIMTACGALFMDCQLTFKWTVRAKASVANIYGNNGRNYKSAKIK